MYGQRCLSLFVWGWTMSDWNYCQGPNCHTYHTVSRIRGVKGNKVLRSRKITRNSFYNQETFERSIYSNFCDMRCLMDYLQKHKQQVLAIEPRPEPLETPVDIVKETKQYGYGDRTYTDTIITER